MLEDVKSALGIVGDYQDSTLTVYIDEVIDFLKGAGVPQSKITAGVVALRLMELRRRRREALELLHTESFTACPSGVSLWQDITNLKCLLI